LDHTVIVIIPPWLALSAVIGVAHASIFHLALGHRIHQLPAQVGVGVAASALGGLIGTMIPPAILAIGDTNLIATSLCAWGALGIARLFRFC